MIVVLLDLFSSFSASVPVGSLIFGSCISLKVLK